MSESEFVPDVAFRDRLRHAIEKASPALRLYIGKLDRRFHGCARRSWSCANSSLVGSGPNHTRHSQAAASHPGYHPIS